MTTDIDRTGQSEPARLLRPADPGPYRPSRAMRLLQALGSRIAHGRLTIVFPDGAQRVFAGQTPGPQAVLEIRRDRLARRFLTGGNLGFCEAYLDGDWSSPDIETLFVFFLTNERALLEAMRGKPWFRALQRLSHMMRPNSRHGARRNIHRHYDLGNAFFERWLDPSMTYSSALYGGRAADLETAQQRKYRAIAERAGVSEGDRVLEIGCGWGGFAEFAARETGAHVTGITISREQCDYARRRVFEAGLADRVDIRLEDYRDTRGLFDRVVSIEMFEAVGREYWPAFFATVRDRLRTGGTAALQVITIAEEQYQRYQRSVDYIQKYIFPGGMLPSKSALGEQVRRAGLSLRDSVGFGPDYAATLREWNRRFQRAWPDLTPLGFDARFKRMWEQYLHYCAAGFAVGSIDVVQMAVRRP
jgi:cyclopropane-fatty-acyl-phospholipid synthase